MWMSRVWAISVISLAGVGAFVTAEEPAAPDYREQVAPILKKYCVGCHNDDDAESKLSLESFGSLNRGGARGPAVVPGDSQSSRLYRLSAGLAEPVMPPDDETGPNQAELAILARWIDAGAKGPAGADYDRTQLATPRIEPRHDHQLPVTALALSPDGRLLAVARFRTVSLLLLQGQAPLPRLHHQFRDLPGKVNALAFSPDGKSLAAASGVAGLYGEAVVWDLGQEPPKVRTFRGGRDTLYAVALDATGRQVVAAGYDQRAVVWNLAEKQPAQPARVLTGHNGAIFSLATHPSLPLLATASADETGKIWRLDTGERLDTLGQPLDEVWAIRFSPDGKFVYAAGADHRIRRWRLLSQEKPRINPPLDARFAHEGVITHLEISANGQRMVTVADDGEVKLWGLPELRQLVAFPPQSAAISAIALTANGRFLHVGRMDGSLDVLPLRPEEASAQVDPIVTAEPMNVDGEMQTVAEAEPNDSPRLAQKISLPATVTGVIESTAGGDADCFRFQATAGSEWMLETRAARDGSPLDSRIEVLTAAGAPIERVRLQAVRDSYFTFRGKNSDISDDFRLFNWQEMELDDYLYSQGEVVKLWLYPRGPDSGFKVYPGFGKRRTYFDTTAVSHALQEPAYIVRPLAPGAAVVPNGLPVFTIYYENDDDATRRSGSDSRLRFTAPRDGEYVARVTDVRGFHGANFKYRLSLRPRQPDFRVSAPREWNVFAGGGQELTLSADRRDDFEGPIQVAFENLPPGFSIQPTMIQRGQLQAMAQLRAAADAPTPTAEQIGRIQVTATAKILNESVEHAVAGPTKVTTKPRPDFAVRLLDVRTEQPLEELTLRPGETVSALVEIERGKQNGPISFGKDDSGRNLPHGVFVDNIGLNGLLIRPGQNRREFFITAAPIAEPTTRWFHLRANVHGGVLSPPVKIRVLQDADARKAD